VHKEPGKDLPSLILPFLAFRKENPMKSLEVLRGEFVTLHRAVQAHYNTIEYHKSGPNILAALFNPNLRRQALQAIAHERRQIESTLLQIQEVQEQYLAALFLECWQDELHALPDSAFLTEETTRRRSLYAQYHCPSLREQPAIF
jgi:hypothetical protein